MDNNIASSYNDFLVKWEEVGGAPLRSNALSTREGVAFKAAMSASPRAFEKLMTALADSCDEDRRRGLSTWILRESSSAAFKSSVPPKTSTPCKSPDFCVDVPPAPKRSGYGFSDPPEFTAALQEISEIWLDNTAHPEDPEGRPQALRTAAAQHTLPVVMAAIRYYSKRVRTGNAGLPYHLVNFLIKDGSAVLKDWIRLSSAVIPEEAVTAFDSVWKKYPPFAEKEYETTRDTAWGLYYQFVAPQDRFGFAVAVESYRESRIGEDQQYTTRFANFIPNWRGIKASEVASVLLGCAARNVLLVAAPSAYHEPRSRGTAQTLDYWCIVKANDYRVAVSSALGAVKQWLPEELDWTPESDVVAEIIETAHRLSFTFCRAIVVQKPE